MRKFSIINQKKKPREVVGTINVTPIVDVMLVLLIIFMITSPMMVAGINVDLPESSSNPISGQDEPMSVTVDKFGKVYINDTEIEKGKLTEKLRAILGEKTDTRIFVRVDRNADYGKVVEVVNQINLAGYSKVALITEIK